MQSKVNQGNFARSFVKGIIIVILQMLMVQFSNAGWVEVDNFQSINTNGRPDVVQAYKSIWYSIGNQTNGFSLYNYSGGLGTYPANMYPMAAYASAANKTFFVYGGTTADDERDLQIMCSYYDHTTGKVPVPTRVRDSNGLEDAHANPAIAIDDSGYIWVFSATRHTFDGKIYRSNAPYDISSFSQKSSFYMAYPQPWHMGANGFMLLFTDYDGKARELYFRTSTDGITWSAAQKFAAFEGHYQNSMMRGNRVGTAFNYHPDSEVTRRTNLYYMQTDDMGQNWKTADGTALTIPLTSSNNDALVIDYEAQGKLVYIHDTNLDSNGNPAILYLTSSSPDPGPAGNPRTWHVTHWDGSAWQTCDITNSTHNYDVGSLHIENDGTWRVIGPTAEGPQEWGAGGEVEMWTSTDQGANWNRDVIMTSDSVRNHTYIRRPVPAHPDFYAYWADGNTEAFSIANIYFGSKDGKVYQLPRTMSDTHQTPAVVAAGFPADPEVMQMYQQTINITGTGTLPTPTIPAVYDGHKWGLSTRWDDNGSNSRNVRTKMLENEIRGSFYLNTNPDQPIGSLAQDLCAQGKCSIGSHSMTHPSLTSLWANYAFYELMANRIILESLTDRPVNSLAFPYGAYKLDGSPEVFECITRCVLRSGFHHNTYSDFVLNNPHMPNDITSTGIQVVPGDVIVDTNTFWATMNDINANEAAYRQTSDCIFLGVHPTQVGDELTKLGELMGTLHDWDDFWHCSQTEWAAYTRQRREVTMQKENDRTYIITRPTAYELGDDIPMTLVFDSTALSNVMVNGTSCALRVSDGKTYVNIPHADEQKTPASIGKANADGSCDKFPGLTSSVNYDGNAVTVTIKNTTGNTLENAILTVFMPPACTTGRIRAMRATIPTDDTWILTIPIEKDQSGDYWTGGKPYFAAQFDFRDSSGRKRLFADKQVTGEAL